MPRVSLALFMIVLSIAASADAASFLRAKNPIPGRYIVQLRSDVRPEEVDHLAQTLTARHGGRLLGTLNHAVCGFGVAMPEARARALVHHPLVAQVEEDGYILFGGRCAVRRFCIRQPTAIRNPH
jgi:hypothetical protein